jgi:hypothetical protein
MASAICRTQVEGLLVLRSLWIYRGFAHPMKEDVKRKSFAPPLREMRVW